MDCVLKRTKTELALHESWMCPWYVFAINYSDAGKKPVPWCQIWTGHKKILLSSPVLSLSSSAWLSLRAENPSSVSTAHSQLQNSYPTQKSDQQSKAKIQSNKQSKTKQNNSNKKKQKAKSKPIKETKRNEKQVTVVLNYIREVSVPLLGRRLLCIECLYWEMLMDCRSEVHWPVLTNGSYFLQQSHNSALEIISSALPS